MAAPSQPLVAKQGRPARPSVPGRVWAATEHRVHGLVFMYVSLIAGALVIYIGYHV
jgi:hypothetical protein